MTEKTAVLDRAIDYAIAEVRRVGDPGLLPLPVRIVALVHAAQGVIDNGGLQYFFESNWKNQPPYSVFIDAYCAIGAAAEADVLAAAVALFPFPDPQKHQEQRNEFMDQFQDEDGHRLDSPFEPYTKQLCGNKEVWRRLESYVSAHIDTFGAGL